MWAPVRVKRPIRSPLLGNKVAPGSRANATKAGPTPTSVRVGQGPQLLGCTRTHQLMADEGVAFWPSFPSVPFALNPPATSEHHHKKQQISPVHLFPPTFPCDFLICFLKPSTPKSSRLAFKMANEVSRQTGRRRAARRSSTAWYHNRLGDDTRAPVSPSCLISSHQRLQKANMFLSICSARGVFPSPLQAASIPPLPADLHSPRTTSWPMHNKITARPSSLASASRLSAMTRWSPTWRMWPRWAVSSRLMSATCCRSPTRT